MGTYVRDALGADLVTGITLNAAGTTTGTAVELSYPGEFQVELVTATVTGTSPTLNVELEHSNVAASGYTSLGRFDAIGDEDNTTRKMRFYSNKRYVRAVGIVGGTSPVFTGTTMKVVPNHDRFEVTSTA